MKTTSFARFDDTVNSAFTDAAVLGLEVGLLGEEWRQETCEDHVTCLHSLPERPTGYGVVHASIGHRLRFTALRPVM